MSNVSSIWSCIWLRYCQYLSCARTSIYYSHTCTQTHKQAEHWGEKNKVIQWNHKYAFKYNYRSIMKILSDTLKAIICITNECIWIYFYNNIVCHFQVRYMNITIKH